MNYLDNKYFISGVIIVSVFIVSLIIERLINKRIKNANLRHLSRKWIQYGRIIIIILILLFTWLKDPTSITTVIGFTSAGLALALHPVFMNIAGWLLIIIKKPINIGDRIEYKSIKGDVIDIQMFYTLILEVGNWVDGDQSTGRVVSIPNGKIFTENYFSTTKGFNGIWNEIKILITFNSNKDKAKKIIMDIANDLVNDEVLDTIRKEQVKMSKKYAIKPGKVTPITYFTIQPSGIQIELRYITLARNRRGIKTKLSESIYEAIHIAEDIEFAYPSQKIYMDQ
ncbi:MAG TPA: mechanosensitive ion channel family protein [Clostridia bacterium]|nr:mechanosensitive ion channel family protein [Clostridia bacterium]